MPSPDRHRVKLAEGRDKKTFTAKGHPKKRKGWIASESDLKKK